MCACVIYHIRPRTSVFTHLPHTVHTNLYLLVMHTMDANTRRDLRLWKSWCSPWMSWCAPSLASCLRKSRISLKNSTSPWQYSRHEKRHLRHCQNMPWFITHLWRPRQSVVRVLLHCFFTLQLILFLFSFRCQTSHAAWTMAEGYCRWREACKLKQITQGYGCQRAECARISFSWDQCLQFNFRTMRPQFVSGIILWPASSARQVWWCRSVVPPVSL